MISVELLKEAVKDAPKRTTIDTNKPIILVTDASNDGWGATLEQDDKPIGFASGKWSSREEKYSTTKNELRAGLEGVKKFKSFLLGARDITRKTDHQVLKSID